MTEKLDSLFHEDKSFSNLIYTGKETRNREFEHCSFINCDFSNGVFASNKFIDCLFTGCNMAMVKLNNCQLNNVIFKDSKLLGVNFSECMDFLFAVKFEGCVLDYCSFAGKKMTKTTFNHTSLKNSDFTGSDLTKSSFLHVDLMNAVFNRAILKEVDFLTADNYIIDPELNNIRKAKFSLQGVPGLLNKYDIRIE
jgi:fluoroquinolone resistance protein